MLYILFVCVEFIVPLENFSLIWRRHQCRWKATKFDLSSALMTIEKWGFFEVPHLLWHGSTLYNSHLRGPVTLTPVAELLAVELSLPVFTTSGLSRAVIEPRSPACEANALPLHLLHYEDLFTEGKSWVWCLWGTCGLKDELKLISFKPSSLFKKNPYSYLIQDDIKRIMISSVFSSTNCNSYVHQKTRCMEWLYWDINYR